MRRAEIAEARAFTSWDDFQRALLRAIAPLTQQQLSRQPLPGRRTVGQIAEHIVFGRALHLHRVLGDGAAALVPFLTWDDPNDSPRSATEIVRGLELTWQVLSSWLARGAPDSSLPADDIPIAQTIWGLLDHDLPHAGQLSMLLRADGLPGVDI